MAQGSSFWQWYGRVNDDMRHQLIDRAWFGQHQRDNAFERHVDARSAQLEEPQTEQHAAVYGRNPHVPEALDGIGARGRDDFNADNVKNVMHEYYGHSRGGMESTQEDRDAAMQRFYGNHHGLATEQERKAAEMDQHRKQAAAEVDRFYAFKADHAAQQERER